MSTKIFQSQGLFQRLDANAFVGIASFVYRENKALFAISPEGEIVHKGHGLRRAITIFLHRDCEEKLFTHTWYEIKGTLFIIRTKGVGFFLPSSIIGQINPQIFSVKGELIMPEKDKPICKIWDNQIVPLNNERGLVVFEDYRSNRLESNHSYSVEATAFVPYGFRTGLLLPTSITNNFQNHF